ncbi:hypothetical protein D3C86_1994280 [compost metagenome]
MGMHVPRDQLLAGAGFPCDQHRRLAGRDALDQLVQLARTGIGEDEGGGAHQQAHFLSFAESDERFPVAFRPLGKVGAAREFGCEVVG